MVAGKHSRSFSIGLLLLTLLTVPVYAGAQAVAPVPQLSTRPAPTTTLASSRSRANIGGLLPLPAAGIPAGLEPFFDLSNADIKFSFAQLTEILRDKKHEGWVLAAYPDPKTAQPLIGAGFTLSLPAREHPQTDPLNPHQFLEPSSEQLWQAAGFDSERLQTILNQYESNLEDWGTRKFRRKVSRHELTPDVTEDEAESLLRVAVVQAIHNARAYCRNFDRFTGPQQMAVAQLVYQMGVNLEEFTTFLSVINQGPQVQEASLTIGPQGTPTVPITDRQYWEEVQGSLIHSQWARKYSTRAITVIAMFDPDYAENPSAAERRVKATLHPARHHHSRSKKSKRRSVRA